MTMTATRCLDGARLGMLLKSGFANLCAHEQVVNDLNVFPIPDGDTGVNLCMTLEGGMAALEHAKSASLGDLVQAVADGALMTARGNSGVILSQLISGAADMLAGHAEADSRLLALAAQAAVKKAYGAVIQPVEGTVLTVAREAAESVCARTERAELTVEEFFSLLLCEMRDSLMRTPELLPVLQEAGVIDSGGAGLVYLVEGMQLALGGKPVELDLQPHSKSASKVETALDLDGFTEDSELSFGYCTELLLRLQTRKGPIARFSVDALIAQLTPLGESIVAFQNGSIVKVHIHTMTPGNVLALCQQYGEFLTVKIENMNLQHSNASAEPVREALPKQKPKAFGVVAVANGEGLCDAFRRFGADAIVYGGQTMNPSPREFIEAFRCVQAETIFVLPNHKNIIPAAMQAASMYADADVRVLETATLGEGYQALTMLDFTSGDADVILENLREAISYVTTAAVSRAVRDAAMDGSTVRAGEYLGLVGKQLLAHDPNRAEAACQLLDRLDTSETEVLVMLIGQDATEEDLRRIRAYAREKLPRAELYELDGGQAVYDLIFVL